MSEAQYRCLVAYMMYWSEWEGCSLDRAIKEIGIVISREDVIHELFRAGYDYDPQLDRIRNTQDGPEDPSR